MTKFQMESQTKSPTDKTRRRLFKAYPACRYKAGLKPMIVNNQAEDELALGDGWQKTPIQQVLADLPDDIKDNAEVVEKITTAVDNVAAVVNMLTRINKVRSKKDLRWLAGELAMDLPGDGYSLKELRKIILDEARIHPDFAAMFKDGQNDEHRPTTH